MQVGALGLGEARELLVTQLGSGVTAAAIEWLVDNARQSAGALELPTTLTPQQLSGQQALAGVLAPATSVEEVYLARVQRLAPSAQRLLLIAASEGAGIRTTVQRAAQMMGLDVADLAPAEAAGLVRVDSESITSVIPSCGLRSTVAPGSPSARRHIASWLRPPRPRAVRTEPPGIVAAATVGTDESVAAQLESTAERARVRSGHSAASAALEAAADLSVDRTAQARRFAAAARAAWAAGLPDQALLDRAALLVTDPG